MRAFVLVLAALSAMAQPPPPAEPPKPSVLTNAGKPMKLPFACPDEDILAFGLSCSAAEPCRVYLEIAGIETAGVKMFLTGNLHTDTVTLWSVFLASEDDGKTWTEPFERIRSSGLDAIQFVDFENGWIAGHQLQALPRDAFFLRTTDGGKTWRKRPVFSESQPGTIEQFWFDSKDNGLLVIDHQTVTEGARFALYETRTGGESWTIREMTSRMPKLKRRAGEEAAGRVRPDAASKSYRVEKMEGQRWVGVASFLIEAGACKPAIRELKEPAPEPELPAVPQLTVPSQPRTPPTLKKKK